MDDFHNQLEELTGLLRRTIRIGGTWPVGPYDLFAVLADFRAQHPGVAVHMVEDTQDTMLAMVRDDELDCAFASVDADGIGEDFARHPPMGGRVRVRGVGRPPDGIQPADHLRAAGLRGPDHAPRQFRSTPAPGGDPWTARPRAPDRVHLHGDERGARAGLAGTR